MRPEKTLFQSTIFSKTCLVCDIRSCCRLIFQSCHGDSFPNGKDEVCQFLQILKVLFNRDLYFNQTRNWERLFKSFWKILPNLSTFSRQVKSLKTARNRTRHQLDYLSVFLSSIQYNLCVLAMPLQKR